MARCGHSGSAGSCDLCEQERIMGQGRQKRQTHSTMPGRRSGSKPPPKAGEGKKKKK